MSSRLYEELQHIYKNNKPMIKVFFQALETAVHNSSKWYYTVPLKSKLPVSSRFSRDENLVSRDKNLVSRDESLVSRESLKRKFWNITKFLARRTND